MSTTAFSQRVRGIPLLSLLLVAVPLPSAVAQDGGSVYFANRVLVAGIDAPVFDVDGVTRLDGERGHYRAQLYAGPTLEALAPVGTDAPFGNNALAGYWLLRPDAAVIIPTVAPGATAFVQVRAWDRDDGASFEAASLAGGKTGASAVFTVVTGGGGLPPTPPADLAGLTSFQLTQPLKLVREPADAVARAGESVRFEALARSHWPVAYQWQFEGVDLPGATNAVLALGGLRPAQAGTYRVVARTTDGQSVSSREVRLTLVVPTSGGTVNFANRVLILGLDAPVFDLDGVTRLAGARFRAQLYAGPTPDALVPAGAAVPFGEGARAGYWDSRSDAVRSLPNVGPGQTALVVVRAWDSHAGATYEEALAFNGRAGASPALRVVTGGAGEPPTFPADLEGFTSFRLEQGPVIEVQPRDSFAFAGQTLRLEAVVTSHLPASVQWQFDGADVPGATATRLDLVNVQPPMAGTYRLIARNADRTTASRAARLEVAPVPVGASVRFNNRLPEAGLDAPVFDLDGTTRLTGTNFVAQLWGGPRPDALAPLGAPVEFAAGEDAGYWLNGSGPWRLIPEVAPGEVAFVQVRVWEFAGGPTYDAAAEAGFRIGVSGVLEIVTGGGPSPGLPAPLTGLESFRLGRLPALEPAWPADVWVQAGQPAAFEVRVASSDTPVAYQWFRNTAPIPGATNRVLVLLSAAPGDAGAYDARVVNLLGSRSSRAARLWVSSQTRDGAFNVNNRLSAPPLDAPVLDVDGATRIFGTNHLAQLYVGLAPEALAPAGAPLTFQANGYLNASQGAVRLATNVGPNVTAYVQLRAWARPAESYEAATQLGAKAGTSTVFSVRSGPVESPAPLLGLKSFRLRQPPMFQVQPQDYLVVEGGSVSLVAAVGSPWAITVQWEFSPTADAWTPVAGGGSTTLRLVQVRAPQEGFYRLRATNLDGTRFSRVAHLVLSHERRLGGPGWQDLELPVDAPAETTLYLEGSTNLATWVRLGTLTNATGTVRFTDATGAAFPARFYRAVGVQSQRVVSSHLTGFVELEFPPAWSMRSVPLIAGQNTVRELLQGLPDGVMIYKYDNATGQFLINGLELGGWNDPDQTLQPGEGFFFRNHTLDTYFLTVRGTVARGAAHQTQPAGWSLVASPLPERGRLDTALALPPAKGVNVDVLDARTYRYQTYVYDDAWYYYDEALGQWFVNRAPTLSLGEAFWVYRYEPVVWTRLLP